MGSLFNPQVYNSTTYVDQLAVQLGLYQDRLTGETAGAQLGTARTTSLSFRGRFVLLATCFGPLRRFNLAHPWNVEV